MHILEATIDIDAPIAQVWQHLTDFANYPAWNPYILTATGELKRGAMITFTVAGGLPLPLNAPITALTPERELTWEARVPIPGFQPRYIRRLEALSDARTRFINREEFEGYTAGIAKPVLNAMLAPDFPQTCQALKDYVEGQ
ncbi:MAG: SRPBCC domain-containing protein [Chloroflexota bacterium]